MVAQVSELGWLKQMPSDLIPSAWAKKEHSVHPNSMHGSKEQAVIKNRRVEFTVEIKHAQKNLAKTFSIPKTFGCQDQKHYAECLLSTCLQPLLIHIFLF